MWNMIYPILIVVASNTVYNICAKSTPDNVNSFASLAVTYLIAAICSAVMFFATGEQKNLAVEISKANWTAYVLGIAIVGLEFGYICIYRAGWKISLGNLVASISLACVLVIVGVLLYKETISLKQVVGIVLCISGIILIAK
ncbi:MAG: DMT family transporter [Oscillospiraceae bacterium]|nr:DMT family transporter [Oscillospiraceae bacterium]